jgi:hypothetical protein
MAPSTSWRQIAIVLAWLDGITLESRSQALSAVCVSIATLLRHSGGRSLGRSTRWHEPGVCRSHGDPESGRTRLDLYERARNEGEQFDPARTGLDHLALAAESSVELEAWANWLDSCDVARSAIRVVADGLGAMLDFKDPDGIQVEFIT